MSNELRAAVIKLAYANPSLRGELLPMLSKEAAERHKGEVWQTPSGNWRSMNQAGNLKSFSAREQAQSFAKGSDKGDDLTKPSGRPRETHEEREKREKAEQSKATKTKLPPKAQEIVEKYNRTAEEQDKLTNTDTAEIKEQAPKLADKTAKSRMSAEERKRKFIANIDTTKYTPDELKAMKARIQKMPAKEFEAMVFAINDEEGEMGKMASPSLRAAVIKLAHTNPSLRGHLLPLLIED